MSMTQEEIEALMNDSSVPDDDSDNSIDDILDGIDGIIEDDNDSREEISENILSGIEGIVEDEPLTNDSSIPDDNSIDDILGGIDGIVEDEPIAVEEDTNIDAMLAGIDGIEDDTIDEVIEEKPMPKVSENDLGILPLPSSKEHKIVNQLNEVAEDSEQKASLIFDALSYILDENEKVSTSINKNLEFIDSQIELLEKLLKKFPNIEILKENLNKSIALKAENESTINIVNEENNKIFEAMEIMQYHDINRQKIERVMSVIKKLTTYLNGIFEDDSGKPEVQIAKHISGDNAETVNEEDLDDLISEFSKEV